MIILKLKVLLSVLFLTGLLLPASLIAAAYPSQGNPWAKLSVEKGEEIEMVRIPGGGFWMGSQSEEAGDDEQPVHKVTLNGFRIGKYEVTQRQWQAVMGSNPSKFKGDNHPVEQVSWDDVQDFIRKLNQMSGKQYRLPTEAEWEYAARGGKDGPGNDRYGSPDLIAWYDGNSGDTTHPVGGKQPNAYGLYDMLGNVWERCSDWYGAYTASAKTNPTGPSAGSNRVIRGGSWYDYARFVRAPYRFNTPGNRHYDLGFRLAMDAE
jgi:formylglycine-generating enzyme required for sulfatase activity